METDEPPDPLVEEVFVSDNGEHDYVILNHHKLWLCQLEDRLKLYEQSPHPEGSFSELMYNLYSEAIYKIWEKRFEKGLQGDYSTNPHLAKDKRLNLKQLIS